jgi:hypothetical protein
VAIKRMKECFALRRGKTTGGGRKNHQASGRDETRGSNHKMSSRLEQQINESSCRRCSPISLDMILG